MECMHFSCGAAVRPSAFCGAFINQPGEPPPVWQACCCLVRTAAAAVHFKGVRMPAGILHSTGTEP